MLKKILFPNQEENEKILILLRRHWIIAFKIFIQYTFILFSPLLLIIIDEYFEPNVIDNILKGPISYPIIIMGLSVFYLFVWIFFFHTWIDYYFDVWIVTDKRIVNIEQKGLFSRTISELALFRVQDVNAEVRGIMPTLFHYGEVIVQSAGNQTFTMFKQVPHPYETSRIISQMIADSKKIHANKLKTEMLLEKEENNAIKTV